MNVFFMEVRGGGVEIVEKGDLSIGSSFNNDKDFKLNDKAVHINDIKAKILTSIRSKEEHLVVIKPDDNVSMQNILSVMEDFNKSEIDNVLLGIKENKNHGRNFLTNKKFIW